jgi:murein DD-endopeptidase MepM/ murein hydrolase activator NlpD
MGRFLSPDPSGLVYADPGNPQSFNLYSYGANNPLTMVDPSGLSVQICTDDGNGGTQCTTVDDPTYTQGATGDKGSLQVPSEQQVENDGGGFIYDSDGNIVGVLTYMPDGSSVSSGSSADPGSGGVSTPIPPINPCSSRNGRPYGPNHRARDYHLPINGTPIPAPENGTVTNGRSNAPHIPGPYNYSQMAAPGSTNYTDFTGNSGNAIRYVHAHPAVPFGTSVNQGDTIATSDNSGRTTGPHTHVQITNPNGNRIDPNTYFTGCR